MLESWGRYPKTTQNVSSIHWRSDVLRKLESLKSETSVLPFGMGRSYGDSCLNDGGTSLVVRGLNRFRSFDREKGLICVEAGVTLKEVLDVIVPTGWFVPVSPGTKFVTVGGAVANDIHGKNHHVAGTFGRHVTRFELCRSDGSVLVCTPKENEDWFKATIGGMGLTGLITWIEFRLKPIQSSFLNVEEIQFENLDEFFPLAKSAEDKFEYTVAWVDCLATEENLGRGIFMQGNGESSESLQKKGTFDGIKMAIPLDAPGFLLNKHTIKIFNEVYFRKQRARHVKKLVHYGPFFYPLDSISNWNRLYGKRGFFQYQCVVPYRDSLDGIKEIFRIISSSGQGSFLSVLKTFGSIDSPGLMSFPMEGVTLALDFPNRGEITHDLFNQVDDIVRNCGGRVYPAKDARMSAEDFKRAYPKWKDFEKFIDPKFSSSFWRRVSD